MPAQAGSMEVVVEETSPIRPWSFWSLPQPEPVPDPGGVIRNVGIAYNKGKAVLGMFETWMGPDVFRRGVNAHLRAHEWKNAVSSDLWSALGQVWLSMPQCR